MTCTIKTVVVRNLQGYKMSMHPRSHSTLKSTFRSALQFSRRQTAVNLGQVQTTLFDIKNKKKSPKLTKVAYVAKPWPS